MAVERVGGGVEAPGFNGGANGAGGAQREEVKKALRAGGELTFAHKVVEVRGQGRAAGVVRKLI